MGRGVSYLCGVCATQRSSSSGSCSECGSDLLLEARGGYVVALAAGTVPCPSCGSTARPLAFRGWARVMGLLIWAREERTAAYVCQPCAEKQTTTTLFFNALLGWWSVPAWFFYGWRALFHNWRAVWTAPVNPGDWGAIDAEEFARAMREERDAAFEAVAHELLTDSPLRFLTHVQQALVLGATGLYEVLDVSSASSVEELRAAYRTRCKQVHPDVQTASPEATEEMIRLNNAWEILRSESMRAAYDWLEEAREAVAA
jgi:hypothetical protein